MSKYPDPKALACYRRGQTPDANDPRVPIFLSDEEYDLIFGTDYARHWELEGPHA